MRPRPRSVPEPVLRDLAERAAAAGLSRRAFLGLLGAAGGATALSACTDSSIGGRKGYLRWGNWPLYLDLDSDTNTYPTLEDFQEETGIKVTYMEDVEDVDMFFGKVRGRLANGQDIGYDLVTLDEVMAERWVRQGYTQEFDRAAMPNTENLIDSLAHPDYDVDRTHTMPWQAGLTGIAWRKDKIPGGLKSLSDLWNPEYHGRVELLSEFANTMGLVLWDQGVDPSGEWGDDEYGTALETVKQHLDSGQIRAIKGQSYKEDLISGDAWAVVAYSGDIFQINAEQKKSPDGPDLFGFAVPEAGGMIFADDLMVPSTSSQVVDAQKLIDFYYDPEVAATVAAYVNYITPVKGAQEKMETIDPELADAPLIFPSDEMLAKCPLVRGFSADEYTRYAEQFIALGGA